MDCLDLTTLYRWWNDQGWFEEEEEDEAEYEASTRKLLIQGIATSIDALSVGFTIADILYPPL